ncbi:MAG: ABC-2 transporter permease, partial [Lachnospiraceae bacterium]|nr:ABC-2 transporter permease [Lachnospiraceae bacterium]
AFMLPIQFKFGTEKGRMVTSGIVGAIMGLVIAGSVYFEKLGNVLGEIIDRFQQIPGGLLIAGILVLSGSFVIISYFISVRVMEKREF